MAAISMDVMSLVFGVVLGVGAIALLDYMNVVPGNVLEVPRW